MNNSEDSQGSKIKGQELLRAGRLALAQGNRQEAHEHWKQAAIAAPRNERVWLALLEIVSDLEDKRVCLENILSINPNNRQAAGQLQSIMTLTGDATTPRPGTKPTQTPVFQRLSTPLSATLQWIVGALFLIALFTLGVIGGILLNLI